MTGDDLRRAIAAPPTPLRPVIQDFLFAPSVFLLTGEPGKGKTVLASQIAVSLSSATPLFGTLAIPTACAVFYCQLEGSLTDQLERLRYMESVIPIATSHLYWHDGGRAPFNALAPHSVAGLLHTMQQFFAVFPASTPRVVILDPIYKAVWGDLAKAEPALALIRFSDRLLHELSATVLLIHHPHRQRYDTYGRTILEDDAYYGHSFLRNHVEIAYVFRPLDAEGQMGELIATKRREDRSLKRLILCYHPESYTCSMAPMLPEESKEAAIRHYLQLVAQNGQTTDFYQVKAACHVSPRLLREIQSKLVSEHGLSIQQIPGKRSLWVPKLG